MAERTRPELRIGYLGPPIDHRENLSLLLASAGHTLHILDDSITAGVYRDASGAVTRLPGSTLSGAIRRLHSQFSGTAHSDYLHRLLSQIDSAGINCVIGYWGTQILGDLIAVKKHQPHVATILNVLCHPTALTPMKIAAQNLLLSRSLSYLDGVTLSGRVMQNYFQQHVFDGADVPSLVAPPCYSSQLFPLERLPARDASPNVLFLGRTDWHRGQRSDDIGTFLNHLLDAGIDVHHAASESDTPHPHRHPFDYLPLAETERFATQFDASLMLYNLGACKRTDRFEVTVPDRLIASVTAGIPVAMPSLGYAAAREYLADYAAVIQFDSADHLARQLRDRAKMRELRNLAEQNSRRYVGGSHVASLIEFIGQRLSQVRASR